LMWILPNINLMSTEQNWRSCERFFFFDLQCSLGQRKITLAMWIYDKFYGKIGTKRGFLGFFPYILGPVLPIFLVIRK
jgi:hypothetical protein